MEPTTALTTCERSLRQLLVLVLFEKHGADWASTLPVSKVEKWLGRSTVEKAKREKRGVAQTSTNPLDFSEFYELLAVLADNWELVSGCLGKKSETFPLLERFETLRDSVAHGRDLLPHESELMSGIAGEIRNKVTLHMSTQDPGGDYYARIESASDSFGFTIDAARTVRESLSYVQTGLALNVGDVVTFQCHATDPQGREITWHLRTSHGTQNVDSVVGQDVRMTWEVDSSHVGENMWISISMAASGPYKRWNGQHDGLAMFYYRVMPPPLA